MASFIQSNKKLNLDAAPPQPVLVSKSPMPTTDSEAVNKSLNKKQKKPMAPFEEEYNPTQKRMQKRMEKRRIRPSPEGLSARQRQKQKDEARRGKYEAVSQPVSPAHVSSPSPKKSTPTAVMQKLLDLRPLTPSQKSAVKLAKRQNKEEFAKERREKRWDKIGRASCRERV